MDYIRSKIPADHVVSETNNYYSNSQMSLTYYVRLAQLAQQINNKLSSLYVSVRAPKTPAEPYGDWNPQLMRRLQVDMESCLNVMRRMIQLQDKFNFSRQQIEALQSMLTRWRVPLYIPLQAIDLKPLETVIQ